MDFFQGGHGFGGVAQRLIANGMDTDALRPYIGDDERSYINKYNPRSGLVEAVPTQNVGTLRFEQWRQIDEAVIKVAKPSMRAVSDLRSRGLTYNVDAMSTVVLSYETVSDVTPATISMKGLRQSEGDRQQTDIGSMPIPLIHKDFSMDARELGVSRAPGLGGHAMPIDTSMVTACTRQVLQGAENLLIGNSTYAYGGNSVYGYINYPGRLTMTMQLPTTPGWTPAQMVGEFLSARQQLINNFHTGPFVVYVSSDWAQYLDDDYSSAYNGNTLRTRLKQIEGIEDIVTLNYLNGFQMVFVQMTEDVVQLVVGMEVRVIQWESMGGWEVNFKVICSYTPRLRQDQNHNSGILHATGA